MHYRTLVDRGSLLSSGQHASTPAQSISESQTLSLTKQYLRPQYEGTPRGKKVEYSHGKPFQKRWEHLNSYAHMHRQKCTHITEVSSLLTAEPVLPCHMPNNKSKGFLPHLKCIINIKFRN